MQSSVLCAARPSRAGTTDDAVTTVFPCLFSEEHMHRRYLPVFEVSHTAKTQGRFSSPSVQLLHPRLLQGGGGGALPAVHDVDSGESDEEDEEEDALVQEALDGVADREGAAEADEDAQEEVDDDESEGATARVAGMVAGWTARF